jgi:hypothetical protein
MKHIESTREFAARFGRGIGLTLLGAYGIAVGTASIIDMGITATSSPSSISGLNTEDWVPAPIVPFGSDIVTPQVIRSERIGIDVFFTLGGLLGGMIAGGCGIESMRDASRRKNSMY